MMKTNLFLLFFLCAPALAQTENLPIVVDKSKTYDDTLFGFKQDLIIEGVVTGDLGVIGSNVYVKGRVDGNITALNGSVTVYRNGVVNGNIVCVGGEVESYTGAALPGKIINYFNPSDARRAPKDTLKTTISLYFALSLCLFLLVIGTFYIFPNQINEAGFELTQDPVRTAIVGVFTMATFICAMFISFLLMVVAVGFPLFVLFFCGFVVVTLFGVVLVIYRFGQLFENTPGMSPTLGILAAVLLVTLGLYLPVISVILVFGLLVFGSGIVIDTRFGTNKQWFTKKARYWSAG